MINIIASPFKRQPLLSLTIVFYSLTIIGCTPAPVYRDPLPDPIYPTDNTPKPNGSIYQAGGNQLFLFEDLKARRPGDLITVILDEQTVAAKSASTNSSKDTSIDISAPTLLGTQATLRGVPTLSSLNSGNTFSGSGDSSQSNSLLGNITVTVTDVMDNGNLQVSGEKLITLNQGRELVSISGVIRPTDLAPNNTILSTLIGNAEIIYSGTGSLASANKAGWLTRFFNSGLWPF